MTGLKLFIVNKEIAEIQGILSSLPRSGPFSHLRSNYYAHLGNQHHIRFALSHDSYRDERDINTSILLLTHAIFLPFPFSIEECPNVIWAFFFLARALSCRTLLYKRADGVMYCIKYLRFLRDFKVEPDSVIISLVRVLGFRTELEPGNAMRDIEEMSALCRKLLSLNLSDDSRTDRDKTIECFAEAVKRTQALEGQPSQQAIECLHEAHMHQPNLLFVSFVLFESLSLRVFYTKSNDDYEEAMAVFDKMLVSHHPPSHPNPYLSGALGLAAILGVFRVLFNGNPEYLEAAISRCRTCLSLTPPAHAHRDDIVHMLTILEQIHSKEFGVTNDLPEPHSGNRVLHDFPSHSDLLSSFCKLKAMHPPAMKVNDTLRRLRDLHVLSRITNITDVEWGAKFCEQILTSLQQSPDNDISPIMSMGTGHFFHRAFHLTNNPEYLNKSIDVYRHTIEGHSSQRNRVAVAKYLIETLHHRFRLLPDGKDFDEIMQLYTIVVTDTSQAVSLRFKLSCEWAEYARTFIHSSTLIAYNTAISLMQDFIVFAPTLENQHFRLVSMRNHIEQLPLDYASYQVQKYQLKEAVKTLEQGRGLLWSELRGMRTSIDQLRSVDSCLADRFLVVNQNLEALTTSSSGIGSSNVCSHDEGVYSGEEMDPFGRTVVKQRKLLEQRTDLITQIRSLPGFENFLMTPSFDTLVSAASHGPVIITNLSKWHSDIIILLYDRPPSLVPMPRNFYDRAKGLKDQLLAARKKGLDSTDYETALTSVLEELYVLVGRPVIQMLKRLNVPEQSRIWWCPTSVLCSLPLHAMGPVCFEGPHKLYFSDLYICSYTPTLSALIESRKPGSQSFEKPSILLVAQPDKFMPQARKEISVVQHLEMEVTTLRSETATPSVVMELLQDHRFAHLSCHGIIETGRPFDACFKLYQGERLTLLEIIRSQLPSAEFAFLSACHTAELTEESISNEGLHLCAAVQYSGFRSVVGTMWAMADIDGPFLAKHFYGSLFSEKWEGVPYYERTAEALRDAVKELRLKRNVSMERWVNFVHYGA